MFGITMFGIQAPTAFTLYGSISQPGLQGTLGFIQDRKSLYIIKDQIFLTLPRNLKSLHLLCNVMFQKIQIDFEGPIRLFKNF